jgi:hypothetical protein
MFGIRARPAGLCGAAIQFHLEGLASDGFVAPASSSSVAMVSV